MNLILRYFKEAVRRFPRQFLASMALILVITAMDTFVPWGLRQYIDQVSRRDDYAVLALGIGFFACYLLVKVFIKIAWYLSLDRFGGAYIEELSLSAERSMAEASYAWTPPWCGTSSTPTSSTSSGSSATPRPPCWGPWR